jgi:hypothetical protein
MKKRILVLLAGFIFCASMAMAATPAAPVFNLAAKSTKVADGYIDDVNDNRLLVVDGNNAYVAFNGTNGEARVVRSTDAGLTWGVPVLLSATGSQPRIAKVKDPLNAANNLIIVTWSDVDGIRYSNFNGAAWSSPVVAIPNSQAFDPWTVTLAAAPNGSVHLFFNNGSDAILYASANNAEASFTSPVQLPWSANWNNYTIAFDSSSNIYAAETYNGVTFHKKAVGSNAWSSVAISPADTSDNLSIAVYDANNIYIAYKHDNGTTLNIWVAASSNGGNTWTNRPVTPNSTVYGTYPSITVNSSKVITVVGHYVNWGPDGRITVNKSSDNGATWSANVNVAGTGHNGSVLNASGKVCVVSSLYGATETDASFYAGAPTDWNQARAIYFSREK